MVHSGMPARNAQNQHENLPTQPAVSAAHWSEISYRPPKIDLIVKADRLVQATGFFSSDGNLVSSEYERLRAERFKPFVEARLPRMLTNPQEIVDECRASNEADGFLALIETFRGQSLLCQRTAVTLAAELLVSESSRDRAEYIVRAYGALLRFLPDADADERNVIREAFEKALTTPPYTFRHLLMHTLVGNAGSIEQLPHLDRLLLQSKVPDIGELLVSAATAPTASEERRTLYINHIKENPLPALMGLNGLCLMMSLDPGLIPEFIPYISGLHGYTNEYWDSLATFTYERGLRIAAERNAPIHLLRDELAASIPRRIFIYVLDITDLIADRFQATIRIYDYIERLEKIRPEVAESLRTDLNRAITRCALLPIHARISLQQNLAILHTAPSATDTDEMIEYIGTGLSCFLSASETQRIESPIISVRRFLINPVDEESWRSQVVENTLSIPSEEPLKVANLLAIPAEFSLVSGIDLDPESISALRWETDGDFPLLEGLEHYGVDPADILRIGEHWGTRELLEFIRVHTIQPDPKFLKYVGEMLKNIDPPTYSKWRAWRYNGDRTGIGEIFKNLTAEQEAFFQADYAVPLQDLVTGHRATCYLTADPRMLFLSGGLPIGSFPCTSTSGGAYYSKNLVSALGDPHIRIAFLIDESNYDRLVFKSLHGGRNPPMNLEDEVARNPSDYSHEKNWSAFQASIISRTLVKMVRTQDNRPGLLCQPTFNRFSQTKRIPINEVSGSLSVLAKSYGIPLFHHPIDEDNLEILTVPASLSPGGQIENYDGAPWAASYRGSYQILACPLDFELDI